jgi:hypothetical protein
LFNKSPKSGLDNNTIDGLVFIQSPETKEHTGLSGITQESVVWDPFEKANPVDSVLL